MEKGFFVVSTFDAYAACIKINTEKYAADTFMASLLCMTYDEYAQLLISYGAHKDDFIGFIFDSKYKAYKFVNHLNKKYLPMLALMGKI